MKDFSKESNQDLIVVKTYEVTKEQFQRAFKNAQDRAEGTTKEGIYVIGIADCIDFVQSVYHAAGLPLHYTMAYSKEELDSFGTLFAQKIMHKYGCRDSANEHFSSVEAVSKEQLAKRLNIGVDKIEFIKPVLGVSLDTNEGMIPKFSVDVSEAMTHLDSIVKTETESVFDVVNTLSKDLKDVDKTAEEAQKQQVEVEKVKLEQELAKAEQECKAATEIWNEWSAGIGRNAPYNDPNNPERIRRDKECQDTWKKVSELKEEIKTQKAEADKKATEDTAKQQQEQAAKVEADKKAQEETAKQEADVKAQQKAETYKKAIEEAEKLKQEQEAAAKQAEETQKVEADKKATEDTAKQQQEQAAAKATTQEQEAKAKVDEEAAAKAQQKAQTEQQQKAEADKKAAEEIAQQQQEAEAKAEQEGKQLVGMMEHQKEIQELHNSLERDRLERDGVKFHTNIPDSDPNTEAMKLDQAGRDHLMQKSQANLQAMNVKTEQSLKEGADHVAASIQESRAEIEGLGHHSLSAGSGIGKVGGSGGVESNTQGHIEFTPCSTNPDAYGNNPGTTGSNTGVNIIGADFSHINDGSANI